VVGGALFFFFLMKCPKYWERWLVTRQFARSLAIGGEGSLFGSERRGSRGAVSVSEVLPERPRQARAGGGARFGFHSFIDSFSGFFYYYYSQRLTEFKTD
jgi:hypothetical protein